MPGSAVLRIAIPQPTSGDFSYNHRSWQEYARAVEGAGGEPLHLALGMSPREIREKLNRVDGICLPGSPADVDPVLYGAQRHPASAAADPAREALDFFLLDHAVREHIPVLAICFGMQSMNVWRGGSLLQDIDPIPVNHSAGRSVGVAHAASVTAVSRLASLLQVAEAETPMAEPLLRIGVNSSHHQAISIPGDGLRVTARCPEDEVIEAVENDESSADLTGLWLLGVQWHPERSVAASELSRRMFRELLAECSRTAHPALTA